MTLVIDAHAHVFVAASSSPRGIDDLAPEARIAPIGAYRERLAEQGIDGAVLVPLDSHDDYVSTVAKELPGSFATVAVASPAEQGRGGVDPVDALRARHEGFPFRALRTMWLGDPGTALADSPMLPALRYLAGQGIALWSYLPPEQTSLLDELGALVPDLAVVLNHLGFAPHDMTVDEHRRPRFTDPLPEEELTRIERLARHRRFHLMFSGHYALSADAYPYVDLHGAGARLVDAFGADRTLWGSDSPWIDDVPGYAATHEIVDRTLPGLSADDSALILGGTVARLLSLSDDRRTDDRDTDASRTA
ncbi:amidohydrolase [Herbiconiux sp. L3-i23]|uniref:amidohydrolase family protein n=1 Tax=Herbiconiux sp. L3-i23 TaxID=2905871 RepID=UPI00204A3225|nr:amidohydrolase family protein [Herbiconiux sp. L3-i23]BDI22597.1 hypothetical protein L3i23_13730 [Herbiconiux sp. L3-i23]